MNGKGREVLFKCDIISRVSKMEKREEVKGRGRGWRGVDSNGRL